MNNKEFLRAVDNIVKEKNIDKSIVYDAMQQAQTSAYKKNYNTKNSNVKVLINDKTGEIKVYSYLTVVEDEKMTKDEYEDYLFEQYGDEDEEVFDPMAYTYDAQGTDNFSSHSLRSLITTFNN